jgi:hypothetical protein
MKIVMLLSIARNLANVVKIVTKKNPPKVLLLKVRLNLLKEKPKVKNNNKPVSIKKKDKEEVKEEAAEVVVVKTETTATLATIATTVTTETTEITKITEITVITETTEIIMVVEEVVIKAPEEETETNREEVKDKLPISKTTTTPRRLPT